MTLGALRRAARAALFEVTPEAEFEARCLLEHVTGLPLSALLTRSGEEADPAREEKVFHALERRKAGEPLQYILGEWTFLGLALSCGPGVLIPREDTGVLVRAAADSLSNLRAPRGVDLCAGTGAVALALARETGGTFDAVEISPAAYKYLEKNCAKYPALRVRPHLYDAFDPAFAAQLPDGLDCVVSNPPYVASAELPTLQREVRREPALALDGGPDGLRFYRGICALWSGKLRPGGVLAVEISETQAQAVEEFFASAGLRDIQIFPDNAGLPRAVTGYK